MTTPRRSCRPYSALALAVALLGALTACAPTAAAGGSSGAAHEAANTDAHLSAARAAPLRLGYFATLTHAPALVAVHEGLFADRFGENGIETQVFQAGPAAVEALNAGALDAAYLGPNPAISTFVRSGGRSAVVVAGAAQGGSQFVASDAVSSVAASALLGHSFATPQLGNTQDVALRALLADAGLEAPLEGGGEVGVTPTASAQAFTLFTQGRLDGAWLAEPWASRFVLEAAAHVLVDDRDTPTAVLLVRAELLAARPDAVRELLAAHLDALDMLTSDPASASAAVNAQLALDAGAPVSGEVLARSFEHLEFTSNPHAAAFDALHADAIAAGTAPAGSIDGLVDLEPLQAVLAERASSATAERADQ